MQTIKTAVVVVLLLGVCYGAYVALNAPDDVLLPDLGLENWDPETPDVSFDPSGSVAVDIPQLGPPSSSGNPSSNEVPTLPTLGLPNPTPASNLPTNPPELLAGNSSPGSSSLGKTNAEGPSVPLPNAAASGPKLEMPTLGNTTGSAPNMLSGGSLPGSTTPNNSLVSTPGVASNDAQSPSSSGPDVKIPSTAASDLMPKLPELGSPIASASSAPSASSPQLPTDSPDATAPEAPKSSGENATESKNGSPTNLPKQTFEVAKKEALRKAADGKLKESLAEMSLFYNSPEVTHEQHLDLIDLLDALAAEVIYSKRHLLETVYNVSPGETLESIASKYKITPETLAKINGMGDSKVILAGTQMKVVPGPFRADINLNRGELTLFLGDLYAGRFPISIGNDPAPREGSFEIVEKRRDRTYYGNGANVIKADDPRNPYGGVWLSLDQNMCIHGSPEMAGPETNKAGCISLAPIDAKDVYALLGQGCRVTIHR